MSDRAARDATKSRLLDHGVAMMLMSGYHGVGLADILKAAKVPKGSFYYYFTSKEEFAALALEHYIEPFIKQLGEHLALPGVSSLDALASYFRALIGEFESNDFQGGCLLGNLMGEIGDTSPAARAALKRAVDRYRDGLARGLARGQEEGSVRKDMTARALADHLFDHWQGAMLRMKIERAATPLNAFLNDVLLGFCRGAHPPG